MATSPNPQLTEVDPREIIGSEEWQYWRWVDMLHSRSALQEIAIRKMAQIAVERTDTFNGGTIFPYLPKPPVYDGTPTPTQVDVVYYDILVRLNHKLKTYPEEALLIAEEIIRDHIGRIGAKAA